MIMRYTCFKFSFFSAMMNTCNGSVTNITMSFMPIVSNVKSLAILSWMI